MQQSVLLASNSYLPNVGGVENSLRYLSKAYQQLGYYVVIVVNALNQETAGVKISGDETVIRVPVESGVKGFGTNQNRMIDELKKVNRNYDVRLVLARYHMSVLAARSAGFENVHYLVPGVVKHQNQSKLLNRSSGIEALKQWLAWQWHSHCQKKALETCRKVWVFSENMRQQVEEVASPTQAISIVKPGVDCQRFRPSSGEQLMNLRRSLGLPTDVPVFIGLGRFVAAKGFGLVIEAMKQIPEAHLLLVGNGPEFSLYQHAVSELGLKGRVTLAGSHSDVERYYGASDAFLMSSIYEPLGQTILEAIACGLPVLAFRPGKQVNTATVELLGEHAFYADEASADALAKLMKTFIESPQKWRQIRQQQMRNLAKTKFSWTRLAQQLVDN